MEQDLDVGEYVKVIKAIERKHVCPVCRKTRDSQSEVLEHFFDDHDVSDLG